MGLRRGLADVIREIAAEQRSRGFLGRSAADLRAEDDARLAEDAERDQELDAARRQSSPGGHRRTEASSLLEQAAGLVRHEA